MLLKTLITKTDHLFEHTSYFQNIQSIQKELLSIFPDNIKAENLDGLKINYYKQTLMRKDKSSTVNLKLYYLRALLNWAYENGYINKIEIKSIKVKSQRHDAISLSNVLRLLKWCKLNGENDLRKIVLIGYYTGARISNIISIQSKDIDNNYVRFWHNKTNRPYSVPIKKRLRVILNSNFIPFNLKYQQVYYIFNRAKSELRLDKGITIHSLRHAFVTNLVKKKVPLPVVQSLANHKNIQTTMLYNHIANSQLEEAINML